jgi:carbon storage regulator CsrA
MSTRKLQEDIEMLVLSRKRSETIRISDDIVIKILKTGTSTVKIGIEAPSHIRVLRGELLDESFQARRGQTIEFPEDVYGETAVACSDQYPQPIVA